MRFLSLTAISIILNIGYPAFGNTFEYFDTADRDDFFATVHQLGPTTTIDFIGQPLMKPINDQYADLGILFEGNEVVSHNPSHSDGFGIVGLPAIEMTFSDPQYWFAADFLGFGLAEFYWQGQFQFEVGFVIDFAGAISDKPFDRVVFYDPGDNVASIDNIYFGAPLTVPAPGALAVLLGGGMAMCTRRRRSVQ